MAKQKLWEGEKSPIAQLSEDLKRLQTETNIQIALTDKLKTSLGSIQATAKSSGSIGGDKNEIDTLKRLNEEHLKAIALLEKEKVTRQALEQTSKEVEKNRLAEIRLMQQRERAFDNYEKKLSKEVATQTRLSSVYSKVDQKLSNMVKEYRDLAVRKELNIKLTEKENSRMDFLATKITKYDQALKATDANSGKFQRNVGNYASGFNTLNNSVNQLTREMPAFANSMQTGFMAISNNLPMFFDEISKLKKANIELTKSGEPTKNVFKSLGSAIFSTSSLLSIGVTLLTVYGAKLIDMISSGDKVNKQAEENRKVRKAQNEEMQKQADFIGRESSEYVGYILQLKRTNEGSKERSRLITQINDKYGITLKNLSDETAFQKMLNNEIKNYIEYAKQKYLVQKNDELIQRNLSKQDKYKAELLKTNIDGLKQELYFLDLQKRAGQDVNQDRLKEQSGLQAVIDKRADLEEKLRLADIRLQSYGYHLFEANKNLEGFGYNTNKNNKTLNDNANSLKNVNTELKEYDDWLQRRIEHATDERKLIDEILAIGQEEQVKIRQKVSEEMFQDSLILATKTGEVYIDTLEKTINDEFDLRAQSIRERNEFEKQELLKGIDATRVLEIERLIREKDELLKQEGLTAEQKTAINESYEQRIAELRVRMLQDEKVVALKREKLELELNTTLGDLNEERAKRLKQVNDELIDAQKQYAEGTKKVGEKSAKDEIKTEKGKNKELADLRKKSIDELIQMQINKSKRIEDAIDKEISANQKLQDSLKEQANLGVDTAQQSLATLKEQEAEKTKAKEKEAKKQETLERIKVAYSLFEASISKGDNIGTASVKTTAGISIVEAIIQSFKKFYHGTDDTGSTGMMRDQFGAITGVTHENETVLSKSDKKDLGFISRQDLKEKVKLANSILYEKQLKTSTTQNFGFAENVANSLNPLGGKLDRLISLIENQPTQTLSEEVVDGIGRAVVATYTKGNDKLTKIYN